eukprot:TRINITY_DN1171_c0_g1_i1.p2 TRINITY_DN1171_c0_g1~~TRINITY_DN1171_c0_g1_i1.p2  ORF type:complete len:218 (+),score=55.86 TRINITY_DN1171_c0_g1_i1:188-841(+)
MSPPKVYGLPLSTCTAKVLATLFEKGVEDAELVIVDLAKGENKKPEYLKLQPFGVIPVYQDEDVTVFESRAIIRYVAHKFANQGTALYGKSFKDKALTEQWLEVESQNFNPLVSGIVGQIVFAKYKGSETNWDTVKELLAKLEKVLDIYEEHLSKSKYLAGDFFSLADLSHLPYTHYLINVAQKGDGIKSRKHVSAWWDDISSRPSWKKVLENAAAK